MSGWLVPALAGLVCGVISGLGIGGGSLLMIWMTAIAGLEQRQAQGINLLYFLPTAAASLFFHAKNRLVDWKTVLWASACGCATAALSAWLALSLDTGLLRKLFGGFLLLVGGYELWKSRGDTEKKPSDG